MAEKGYDSKCFVNMVGINYKRNIEGAYDEIREEIFNSTYRQAVIKHIVRSLDHPVLILVELVEKEGEILENELKQFLPDREVVFLSGRNKEEEREHWRKYADGKNKCVLIATYGIFQQGINIKSLRSLIFASPSKSKIRVLQSIGRTLRKHTDKINGAIIWDIVDKVKFLEDHSEVRIRYYNKEKFPFKEIELTEGGRFDDLDRLIKGKE
jgi:superfamily II DNA or RNA helicase